jgi:4-alpha-glucanotransferase
MASSDEQVLSKQRGAGILMHITSLPGPAYIGDIGPAAARFAEFLYDTHQAVWQVLPVQPATQDQGFSPYSSASAFAGNPLLISPEYLARDGLVSQKDLRKDNSARSRVDYHKAQSYKEDLLNKAWKQWNLSASQYERTAFIAYCSREENWLNDFALYSLIKQLCEGQPWYMWPSEYKDKHHDALRKLEQEHSDALQKIKWIQMIFEDQWTSLRKLCESMGVHLLGDVPIYVSYDSADVWSHRDLFTLDESGRLVDVAGVPPDLFNDEGQLWGMPLYRWDKVKVGGYKWWIERLRKNLEWFHFIRLDHFRGFSSYWSVPASAKSAKAGRWIEGPGKDLFEVVKTELGRLPFVAEDLGEIDQPVYTLRDMFDLPGMNVLQFAFGDDMPKSTYLPHNYIRNSVVYTGTHDNNTTVGWFKDASKTERKNLSAYLGYNVTSSNVAGSLIGLAYMSVSNLAMIPMQDILSLGSNARMNQPATLKGNWTWRMPEGLLTPDVIARLRGWMGAYDRRS